MILILAQKEIASTVLHMSIMRKSYRNVVKKRYKLDRGLFMDSYDFILDSGKKALEDELDTLKLDLNIFDVKNLKEFIKSYTEQLKKEKIKFEGLDEETLIELINVQQKCEELLECVK